MYTSLYVHVPFCRAKCDYCDFFSLPISSVDEKIFRGYSVALQKELDLRIKQFGVDDFSSVYIGGGTPLLLLQDEMKSFFDFLKKNLPLNICSEITVEANPENITEKYLECLHECSVTRLSIGIQSLNDRCLCGVSRRTLREKALNALEIIKKCWLPYFENDGKSHFSVDLIAGLPFQTEESLKEDIDTLLRFTPDHISLYSLTVEEGTPLYRKIEEKKMDFSFDKVDELWLKGKEYLEEKGFFQYEISNFSSEGRVSLHNKSYWNMDNYIGIGAGATGTFNDYRYTNSRNIKEWMSSLASLNDLCSQEEKEMLSEETQVFEYLMMGFRKTEGVSAEAFRKRFNSDLENRFSKVFSKWYEKNLLIKQGERIFLSKEGLLFLNRFLEEILEIM